MMTETRTEAKTAQPVREAPPAAPRQLADASASVDGLVHQLLAQRQTAYMNDDKAAADAVTAQLAELGYR